MEAAVGTAAASGHERHVSMGGFILANRDLSPLGAQSGSSCAGSRTCLVPQVLAGPLYGRAKS